MKACQLFREKFYNPIENYAHISNMLDMYYKFAYYTCGIPYCFRREKQGKYYIHQNLFQKVIAKLFNRSFVRTQLFFVI